MRSPSTVDAAGAAIEAAVRERRRALARTAAALLALTLVGVVLAKAGVLPRVTWDDVLAMRERFPLWVVELADAIAFLAKPVVAALSVGLAALVTHRRHGVQLASVVVGSALVVAVSSLLKHGIGPVTSLPSGHAAYAASFFGALACLTLAEGRRGGAACLVAIALVMAPARVISGAHEPADVIAGLALGAAWLIGLLLAYAHVRGRRRAVTA